MEEKLKVAIAAENQLFGSSHYVLLVNIVNVHDQEVVDVDVEPVVIPGRLINDSAGPKEIELTELEAERRNLIREMEAQVVKAYERQRIRNMDIVEKLVLTFYRAITVYVSVFVARDHSLVPTWAKEAIKINEWSDVERLENDIISSEKEGSFLRKAFMINKDKLKRCLERLETTKMEGLRAGLGITLAPGNSVTFPFTVRAPHIIRPRTFDSQFKVTFKDKDQEKLSTHSQNQKLYFYASPFAVPTGGILGAMACYTVKSTLLNSSDQSAHFIWLQFGGSIVLGLIAAVATARSPESKKAITVEDFVGGFIIGALSGLFSDKIIAKIGSLLK